MSRRRTLARRHRAFALVAVLVVMTGALLVASALLLRSVSEAADSAAARQRAQSRATAWSGLQAIMARLDQERERVLGGEPVELDERFVIYEAALGDGVVRLLAIGAGGERLVPEAGLLDLNRADAAQLELTNRLDATQAQAVVAHRDGLPGKTLFSLGSLLAVPEISAEDLWGPIDDLAAGFAAPEPGGVSGNGPADRHVADAPRGLADVATVWSVEPALQRDGRRRLRLEGVAWSEELQRRCVERFGTDVAETLHQVIESDADLGTEAGLFEALASTGADPATWPDIVDTFTAEEGTHHFGRLDINAAPYEALSALTALEAGQAAAIIEARGDLDAQERSTIAWPAIKGIIEPRQYPELAGWITTRSFTYRLRLEAGEQDHDDPDAPLRGAVVYEAVIDLSSPRARLAELRDVTLLPLAAAIARSAGDEGADGEDDGGSATPDPEPAPITGPPSGSDPGAGPDSAPVAEGAAPEPRRRIGRWMGS